MALITYLTTVKFGYGEIDGIAADLAGLGVARPLIIADKGVVATGLVDKLFAALPAGTPRVVFDAVPTNPTEEAALEALALYREAGCDGVIGFGGGSPIDLAKAVALLATHEAPLARYALIDGGLARITPAVAPVIADADDLRARAARSGARR
jgi:4-hydroxybutyrate dehydrogenase